MPQTSFALMTTLGRSKEAAALANATTIQITQIAIGDGSTVPSGGETSLYNEVDRFPIAAHGVVVGASNVAYFDAFLAAEDGPYTIREAGLYDSDGDLIAIAHYNPPISKPTPDSGQTVEGTVRLEVAFSNVANITIVVDPSMQVALQRLSRLPWIPVISMTTTTPPASPTVGDCYLIPSAATGAWVGQAGKIAERTVSGWSIITPSDGHGISLPDGRVFERVSGIYIEKIALDAQVGKWSTGTVGGTANAITATLAPAPLSLAAGMSIVLNIASPNTGSATLNVNGFGAAQVVNLFGAALSGRELIGPVRFTYDGTKWWAGVTQPVLTANLTFYVNAATGNDNNNGVTSGTAFATIQKAVQSAQRINLNGYAITINVADGTYAGPVLLGAVSGGVTIIGNITTPSNCIVTQPTGSSFLCATGQWSLRGFKVSTVASSGTDPAAGVYSAGGGAQLNLADMAFGSCVGGHIYASNGGGVVITGKISVSGDAPATLLAVVSGTITIQPSSTVELNIPNAFTVSLGFAVVNDLGTIWGRFSTFTGPGATVTGLKYAATRNGVIDTLGAGINHFPGGGVGTTATGGQYA